MNIEISKMTAYRDPVTVGRIRKLAYFDLRLGPVVFGGCNIVEEEGRLWARLPTVKKRPSDNNHYIRIADHDLKEAVNERALAAYRAAVGAA